MFEKVSKQKKEDEKNKELCKNCNSECCKYVAIEIDAPEELKDFEDIKWYVAHKNINVYVDEDNEWHVEFLTPCEHLNPETGLCDIYNTRPRICREFSQDECPFHNDYTEKFTFNKIQDVEDYIKKIFNQGKHELPEENEN